jgi:hypothetical protein
MAQMEKRMMKKKWLMPEIKILEILVWKSIEFILLQRFREYKERRSSGQ